MKAALLFGWNASLAVINGLVAIAGFERHPIFAGLAALCCAFCIFMAVGILLWGTERVR